MRKKYSLGVRYILHRPSPLPAIPSTYLEGVSATGNIVENLATTLVAVGTAGKICFPSSIHGIITIWTQDVKDIVGARHICNKT